MAPRADLKDLLITLLGSDAVYFQPPPSTQIEHPCIIYKLDDMRIDHADDIPYNKTNRYQVTVIDRSPNSEIPDKIAQLPLCSFDRGFPSNGLNHYVFNLYF